MKSLFNCSQQKGESLGILPLAPCSFFFGSLLKPSFPQQVAPVLVAFGFYGQNVFSSQVHIVPQKAGGRASGNQQKDVLNANTWLFGRSPPFTKPTKGAAPKNLVSPTSLVSQGLASPFKHLGLCGAKRAAELSGVWRSASRAPRRCRSNAKMRSQIWNQGCRKGC